MTYTLQATPVTSRDNPLIKELRKLCADGTAYRKTGRIWIEGEHLCSAYTQRGLKAAIAVFSDSFYQNKLLNTPLALTEYAQAAIKLIVIPDAFMAELSGLDSVAGMGLVCDIPNFRLGYESDESQQFNDTRHPLDQIDPAAPTVILDRLQDPGNVGSILRSAAAFGFKQVIALKGSAALYAPKVLRAGMGAHFGLKLIESAELESLKTLQLPLATTSSHQGHFLHEMLQNKELLAQYPRGFSWILGHEGQGVSAALQAMAQLHVRIAQPGGEESLNVAAAAAICLHASAAFHA